MSQYNEQPPKKDPKDYKEDTSAQEYKGRWQGFAQSRWTTIGIILIFVVVTMLRAKSSNTSAISFGIDQNDVVVISPNVSDVFSIDDVEECRRVSTAAWEKGELILEHAHTDNTIEAQYRNAEGEYLLMIYPTSPDVIVVRHEDKMVVFNATDAMETDQWYHQLTDAVDSHR